MRINDFPDHQNHRKKRTNNVAKKRTARDKSRSGFTLAEMLITVAIIGILAAFGFVAVIRYQKSLKQTELDDTARQIFVAAQNHMTVSRASGNWDTYVAEAEGQKGGGTDKLGASMGAGAGDQNGPSDYDKNSLGSWNSSWANVTSAKDQEHDFRYVTVSADDTNNPGILSMILPYNAIDETLRGNGNIVIEYDAKTAAVYGVWYCKMADLKKAMSTNTTGTASSSVISSIANTGSYKNDNRVSKSNRMKSDPMVGYYGGATAAQKEGEKQDTLSAIIENDDRLMLQVAVPDKDKSGSGSDQRTYTVKAVITGQTSKHSREIKLGTSEDTPILQKNTNSLNGVYKDSSSSYRLYYYTLDSVTDGAEGHFASRFCNASDKERLLPGENLTITVSLSYDGEASRKGSTSNGSLSSKGSASNDASSVTLTANSLFANGSANDDQTAGIVYGRHLQNLSTVVSGVNREASGSTGSAGNGSNSGGSGAVITKAKMMRDLDWSKMTIRFLDSNPIPRTSAGTEAGSSGSSSQNYAVSSYNSEWNTSGSGSGSSVSEPAGKAVTAAGKFYSISDSALTAFNGNGCVISNLQIDASKILSSGSSAGDSVTYAGLFGYVDSGIAEDSQEEGGHSAGGNASGSPAGNSMTVSLLTLKNPTAENATFAGFVIGKTDRKTSVQNVTITSDQSLSIAADQAAGGILGEAESTYTNIQYAKVLAGTRLTVSANNNSFSTAGGILGGQIGAKTGTEGTGTGLSIENCTVSVSGAENSSSNTNNAENNGSAGAAGNSDKSVQVSGGYSAGGILGYCGASEADITGGNSAGSSAGNSVYNGAVNIQNCSAIGAGNEDLVSARKAAAGLAAYISAGGKVDIENNAASVYVAGSDSQNSSGAAGFGGLIGYLNSTINESRVSNCYVGGRTANGEYKDTKDTVNDNTTQGRYNIRGYGYVGGFIGQIAGSHSLKIEKCFTTASAYSATNGGTGNGGQSAAQAGNFVGYSSNSSAVITSCYATGLTNGTVFAGGKLDAASKDNYYLKGVNKEDLTGANVKGEAKETAGTPFAKQTATVKTNTYDKTLKGDYPYQMISGQSAYYGDWVIPKKTQSFNGDFGILYYEIVQHGDQAGASKDAYYHGYVGNVALDEGDNNIQEVNTNFTLHSKGQMDVKTGLLTAVDGGEYVTEDGYILLLADKYASNEVEIDFNWNKTMLSQLDSDMFIPYDAITKSLNISGYHAYYLNAENGTVQNYILRNTDESNTDRMNVSFLMSSGTEEEKDDPQKWKQKLILKCNPYFADYILTSSDTTPFTIRSAHQLNTLFGLMNGGKYIGKEVGTGKTAVTQTMDISYDKSAIQFTYLGKEKKYLSPTIEGLRATYQGGQKSGGRYYKLDHLTQCLVNQIFDTGELKQLDITNMSAYSVVNYNAGELKDLKVSDSAFQKSALVSTDSPGNISDCSLYGVSIGENGIAGENHGTISNVTVERADIDGNGFVTKNQGWNNQTSIIKNCIITDSKIGQDGIATYNYGSISEVSIQEAMISGNGFVSTNGWGPAQTITNCSIVNAQIGKNGFCETNSGTITNCQVYADNSLYESYLQKYESGTGYYHPNDNTIDSSLSEDRKRSEGYNLMVCGVVPDADLTDSNINETTAGFVNTNTNTGTIRNCSYSGKVYGRSQAAGFFCTATGTIEKCYANVLVSAEQLVSGFGISTQNNASIRSCHSVGMTLGAEKGVGFLNDGLGATLDGDYSAIWNNTTNYYSLFIRKNDQAKISNCGYLFSMDGITEANPADINGVTKYSHTELSKDTSMGTKAAVTAPYNQYTAGSQYPYPMPSNMTAYGDWSNSAGYTIEFNANGGSGSMESMEGLQYIETYKLSKNTFTRKGYIFVGWEDKKNDKTYRDEEEVRALSQTGTVVLYALWKEINNSVDFSYTGSVQRYKAPYDGWYKLEVWGAQGGSGLSGPANDASVIGRDPNIASQGGKGGYSVGYSWLKKDQTVYVYVGGQGDMAQLDKKHLPTIVQSGGWNGGGYAKGEAADSGKYLYLWGSGGGASHIALSMEKNLAAFQNKQKDVLLVAGGGGGAGSGTRTNDGKYIYYTGGAGGGTTGENGKGDATGIGIGGTSNSGGMGHAMYFYESGKRCDAAEEYVNGSFGAGGGSLYKSGWIYQKGNNWTFSISQPSKWKSYQVVGQNGAGGGGGWYGGGMGYYRGSSAGGGSGYVSSALKNAKTIGGADKIGMPSLTGDGTMVGNTGNGYGRITYLPNYMLSADKTDPSVNQQITVTLTDSQDQAVKDAVWTMTDSNGKDVSDLLIEAEDHPNVRKIVFTKSGTYTIKVISKDDTVNKNENPITTKELTIRVTDSSDADSSVSSEHGSVGAKINGDSSSDGGAEDDMDTALSGDGANSIEDADNNIPESDVSISSSDVSDSE